MALVQIDPAAERWPVLEAGKYGPGCDFEAECEVTEYNILPQGSGEGGPGFDQDCSKTSYAFFRVQVRPADQDKPIGTVRHWEDIAPDTGSRALKWLVNIGVNVADDGAHDTSDVVGRKCIVEMGEPRRDKNDPDKRYDRFRNLFGVG